MTAIDLTTFRPSRGFKTDPAAVARSEWGGREAALLKLKACHFALHGPAGIASRHRRRDDETWQDFIDRICAQDARAAKVFFNAAVAREMLAGLAQSDRKVKER